MDTKKFVKKIILFAGMFGIPAFFILFFSRGEAHYVPIPFFGDHKTITTVTDNNERIDTISYYRVNGFSFKDLNDSLVTEKDFEGKFIIANFLFSSCPYDCPMSFKVFDYLIYQQMLTNKSFKDVKIISHFISRGDTLEEMKKFIHHHKFDNEKWMVVYGNHNAIFDVDLGNGNTWNFADTIQHNERAAYGITLLLDKQGHIRGKYVSSLDPELRRISKELSLLMREEEKKLK